MNTWWLKLGERDAAPTELIPPYSQMVDDAPGPSNPRPGYTSQSREGISPEKQSASSSQNNKEKSVDQEGNNQPPPPPPPHNRGGDPDPDDDHPNYGDDNRGRKGSRPAPAPRHPSIPRDMSPKMRAIIHYLERITSSTRQIKKVCSASLYIPRRR